MGVRFKLKLLIRVAPVKIVERVKWRNHKEEQSVRL